MTDTPSRDEREEENLPRTIVEVFLLAMLVMDAIFGIPGVIAAPVYYAYLKNELSAKNLI